VARRSHPGVMRSASRRRPGADRAPRSTERWRPARCPGGVSAKRAPWRRPSGALQPGVSLPHRYTDRASELRVPREDNPGPVSEVRRPLRLCTPAAPEALDDRPNEPPGSRGRPGTPGGSIDTWFDGHAPRHLDRPGRCPAARRRQRPWSATASERPSAQAAHNDAGLLQVSRLSHRPTGCCRHGARPLHCFGYRLTCVTRLANRFGLSDCGCPKQPTVGMNSIISPSA
jgi:hypothetical protein